MSLQSIDQGALPTTLVAAVKELQGLTVTTVAGVAAGTAMAVAALRSEDTLVSALVTTDAGGAAVNDVANLTIQPTAASGTITISGNPPEDATVVVNSVTYTFKAAPDDLRSVRITAGNNTAMAAALAAAINAYETRYVEPGGYKAASVVATAALGVVTVVAVVDGTAGNAYTLTKTGANLAVTGAGTLTGGTATGGVKSTTNLTGKTLTLFWFNKK